MKNIRALFSAAVCGLVLASAFTATAQTIQQGAATVVRVKGEAQYSLGDGNWHPVVAGKILGAGAILRTGHDAMLDIVLGREVAMPQARPVPDRISPAPDSMVRGMVDYRPSSEQNVVRMSGDTTLAIDKLTVSDTGADTVSDTELDLKKGRIFASVKKLSGASKYLVKIPTGIAGVRGTLFGIGADGWLAVIKNSVLLSLIGPDGNPVVYVVGEGNQFNPATGQTSPLSPELEALLQQIATALGTVYQEIVTFSFDRTTICISPTTGHHHGHDSPDPQ